MVQIGCVGGEIWRIDSEKVVSTPRKTRHWSPSWLQSSSGAINNLPVGPDLDCSQLGDQFNS